ncbi:MAG: cryptochrome/photolyase family protein [Planctomycetes bacterium]|nr:cryptochrome/photolyase family protein [Planctomycetota bacterium]
MAAAFTRILRERQPDPAGRSWVYVPYDQLTDEIGPLAAADPVTVGIVLIESTAKAARRPYHRQKLALIIANLRQFALEQAARGVAVRHVVTAGSYADALAPLAAELGPLRCMTPAERELRGDLAPLRRSGALEFVPHAGWLTTTAQFEASHPDGAPWRMDRFYRHVRRDSGILMRGSKPEGGKFSFDAANRRPWRGEPPAPELPTFRPDEVTAEVLELIEREFGDHPGQLDGASLPATARDAAELWRWARASCLREFGPFQDAMAAASSSLFHTRISALLHLHRLLPAAVVADVLELDLPIASREGFVRQVLGWREFVRHVHAATDGFRRVDCDHLGASRPLPPAFWGERSGLACLDRVVADVWREGYGHHITRLMVLANIATLLDVSPRELTDWFWVAYADAFDWVVEPNVLGMGTFAVGDVMTTKPYVAGSAYVDRMSDYCGSCAFDPKKTCPLRALYWAFLERHRERLADNPRLAVPLASAAKRSAAQRAGDAAVFEAVASVLAAGRELALPH